MTINMAETVQSELGDAGTKRPKAALSTAEGTHFILFKYPDFPSRVNLPTRVLARDVLGLFTAYFTREIMELLV